MLLHLVQHLDNGLPHLCRLWNGPFELLRKEVHYDVGKLARKECIRAADAITGAEQGSTDAISLEGNETPVALAHPGRRRKSVRRRLWDCHQATSSLPDQGTNCSSCVVKSS